MVDGIVIRWDRGDEAAASREITLMYCRGDITARQCAELARQMWECAQCSSQQ
jgi:hypothetical protein